MTDLENSTRLAREYPETWEKSRARHHILRDAPEIHYRFVIRTVGYAYCVTFHKAADALNAALQAQQASLTRWDLGPRQEVTVGFPTLPQPSSTSACIPEEQRDGLQHFRQVDRLDLISPRQICNCASQLEHAMIPVAVPVPPGLAPGSRPTILG